MRNKCECEGCGAPLNYGDINCSYCLRWTGQAPKDDGRTFIEYTFLESDKPIRIETTPYATQKVLTVGQPRRERR